MSVRFPRSARTLLCGAFVLAAGCHGLLDVTDPTRIQDNDIANAPGANARRLNAVVMLTQRMSQVVADVALITDEQFLDVAYAPPSFGNNYLNFDRRDSSAIVQKYVNDEFDYHLARLDEIYTNAGMALYAMRANGAGAVKNEYLSQLLAIRGLAVVQMAEDLCPGFPINDIAVDNQPVFTGAFSTDSALNTARAVLDSALAYGHDSTQYVNFARVVKARALIDLGLYDVADSVVTSVPTSFTYSTDADNGGSADLAWSWNTCCIAVADSDGGNGLPFLSAKDPRVPAVFQQVDQATSTDSLFGQAKYGNINVPIVIASGIEARLIQAEAALHRGDAGWITILNQLRTTCTDATTCPSPPAGDGGVAGLAPLDAPSGAAAQINLLYRERAFWLYLTGRRLGDLRRLIRNYGRDPETVFPTGTYRDPGGGTYGTAISIPFTYENQHKYNAKITAGCSGP